MELDQLIEAVRADNISGAQSITSRAASIVRERIGTAGKGSESLKSELLDLGRALTHAQPAMASIFNLFNTLLLELENCREQPDSAAVLHSRITDFSRALDDQNRAIAEHVCSTIPDGAFVFTHSGSSTLRIALEHTHETGKRFTVFCTESRPACEGAQQAKALIEAGVNTCLTTDSLIFSLLRERRKNSIVVVGADAITVEGVINKAGTLGLATATQRWGVPFYVLSGSEKFLPAEFFPRQAIQDKPPEEILSSPPPGLRIINRYFDITPLDCVTAVVSETGLSEAGAVAEALERLPVNSDLLAVLTE